MRAARLIVVANRLPLTLEPTESGLQVRPSSGGLVTALDPLLTRTGGCWVGWTGAQTQDAPQVAEQLCRQSKTAYALAPVSLTAAEQRQFYDGCCNQVLWPLFHDLQSRCTFDPQYWDAYREVTEKYADAVERVGRPHDFIWVHDYHLMLLADALHARQLPFRTAYFHHIPFPPPDIFEKLPWRGDILRGLLRFSAVGFQTDRDRRNFLACLRRCLSDVRIRRLGSRFLLQAGERCCTVGTFPISIDFKDFETVAATPAVSTQAADIRRGVAPGQIVLGIDRLDYTKGISERLLGFRALLQSHPQLRGRVTLIQVVVPSREGIAEYQELRLRLERLISEVNGEFGTTGWTPILYLHRCLSRPELLAFYRAADVALITPLKDGMNLVAKEFCASRVDGQGVLVLSEFAGAATELSCGALLVNPYDLQGMATALGRALAMSPQEQRARMQPMRAAIRKHDVFAWCRSFCGHATSQKHTAPQEAASSPLAQVAAQFVA